LFAIQKNYFNLQSLTFSRNYSSLSQTSWITYNEELP
jgi:hypothetical protein